MLTVGVHRCPGTQAERLLHKCPRTQVEHRADSEWFLYLCSVPIVTKSEFETTVCSDSFGSSLVSLFVCVLTKPGHRGLPPRPWMDEILPVDTYGCWVGYDVTQFSPPPPRIQCWDGGFAREGSHMENILPVNIEMWGAGGGRGGSIAMDVGMWVPDALAINWQNFVHPPSPYCKTVHCMSDVRAAFFIEVS